MGRFVFTPGLLILTFLLGLFVTGVAEMRNAIDDCRDFLHERVEVTDASRTGELADEWAVYEALIKEEGLDKSRILIQSDSMSYDTSAYDSPIVKDASVVANMDYRYKNRTGYPLSRLFPTNGASFITKGEIDRLPEDSFWQAFHLRHPLTSGILSLSRVGFSSDRSEAIVSFSYSCGGLCGHGASWKFTRLDGQWKKTGSGEFEIYA